MKPPQGPGRLQALRALAFVAIVVVLVSGRPSALAAADQPRARESAAAVLGAGATADAGALRGQTYVALGDSISEGKFATAEDRIFPALVAQQLGMRLDLVARSGARADWALSQLPAVQAAQPALVTIELGTNDVGYATPPDLFAAQYEAIVGAVSAPATRVLCVGSWLPSDSIDGIIRATCERHGGIFVSLSGFYFVDSFHAPNGAAVFLGRSDWFHPGDRGHVAIAAVVLASLPGYDGSDPLGPPSPPRATLRAPS